VQAFFSTQGTQTKAKEAALNVRAMILRYTDCDTLYLIKDYEDHQLGWAEPGDLFIEVLDVTTEENFQIALADLDQYWNRRCWLLCAHDDDDGIELAQRSKFFWLSPGVWFRTSDLRPR
jgi:hypothetical protein